MPRRIIIVDALVGQSVRGLIVLAVNMTNNPILRNVLKSSAKVEAFEEQWLQLLGTASVFVQAKRLNLASHKH